MKKFRVLWSLALFLFLLALLSIADRNSKSVLVYRDSLEQVLATVQGEPLTLLDFAVYAANEEAEVELQARAYDETNLEKYWNLHTNGQFIRYAARDAAVGIAIHDLLFSQLAEEMQVSLSEEDRQYIANEVMDFWADLVEDEKEQKLGITKEDVEHTYQKIALAEKAQFIYAQINGVAYEAYDYGKETYEQFLSNYEYEVDEKVLEKLNFGNITISH